MNFENNCDLESRFAQIEDWKKRKDDAEYQAKIKAEKEYWEAVDALKVFHKRMENICALANKLNTYKINLPDELRAYNHACGLIYKDIKVVPRKSFYFFGTYVMSNSGFSIDGEVLLYDDEFKKCRNCSELNFRDGYPSIYDLKKIYTEFPKFEKKFYDWFDKKMKE